MVADKTAPDTILVSASSNAKEAYDFNSAESFIYRKEGDQPWEIVGQGLPDSGGMMISNLGVDPSETNTFYVLNNQGLYYSMDKGITWNEISIECKKNISSKTHSEDIEVLS